MTSAGVPTLRARLDLVPEHLAVEVYEHVIQGGEDAVPCHTYVSQGFTALGHRELALTVKTFEDTRSGPLPEFPSHLFRALYTAAHQGKPAELGGWTQWEEPFVGFTAGLYLAAPGLEGVELPPRTLSVLLLTGDELTVTDRCGVTRVLSLLGRRYRSYPYPIWADPFRPSVVTAATAEESVLVRIPHLRRPGVHVTRHPEKVVVSLRRGTGNSIRATVEDLPEEQPIALFAELDVSAGACLYWQPGQETPGAIRAPGGDAEQVCGNHVSFVPDRDENEVRPFEDGFMVFLTRGTWKRVRDAIAREEPLTVPGKGDGPSLEIVWQEINYCNPVDGRIPTAEEGWRTHTPGGAGAPKPADEDEGNPPEPVQLDRVLLLTGEDEVAQRVTTRALTAFVQQAERAVKRWVSECPQPDPHDLCLQFEVPPGGALETHIAARPELPDGSLESLRVELATLLPPPVRDGSIVFQTIFLLR